MLGLFKGSGGRGLDRPVFIWGAPRSGTTLLYESVVLHPDVGCLRSEKGNAQEGTRFLRRAFGKKRGVRERAEATPRAVRRIHKEYGELLESEGKSRLVDKVPGMVLWVPLLREAFPDARHIHIIRDGRAVVNSVLYKLRYSEREKDGRFQRGEMMFGPCPPEVTDPMRLVPAERHALQWLHLVRRGREEAKNLGDACLEFKYEDFISDPRSWMKRVFEHAQLPCDDGFVLEKFEEKFEDRNYKWREKPVEAGTANEKRDRESALAAEDLPCLEVMNPLLEELGYMQPVGSSSVH